MQRFDSSSYLYITKAINYYDLITDGSLAKGFEGTDAKFLMISVSTDWLYPPHLSEEIVTALHSSGKDVLYTEVMSGFGYDGSLLEHDQMNYLIGRFLTPLMVADTMICHPPTPFASTSIRAAAAAMIDHEVKPLPSVLRVNGTICGIVTSWGTL